MSVYFAKLPSQQSWDGFRSVRGFRSIATAIEQIDGAHDVWTQLCVRDDDGMRVVAEYSSGQAARFGWYLPLAAEFGLAEDGCPYTTERLLARTRG